VVQSDQQQHAVAVAILTHNRPDDLARLLDSLRRQTSPVGTVVIVDNGTEPCELAPFTDDLNLHYLKSEANLGGAGGFSLAILTALSSGAEWIWVMDDDARPESSTCLEVMLEEAITRELSAVSPIIVAPEDGAKLSFPFRVEGKLTYDRVAVERTPFWPRHALLFNGLLIRREAVFEIGLPDLKLFIRGDEVDYLLRLRDSGLEFGTASAAAFVHPTGWAEVSAIVKDRFHILVPETEFKRYYFFRNRGYLIRRHKRPVSLIADLVGYSAHYLAKERDPAGFRAWLRAFWAGLRLDFSGPDGRRRRRSRS
jgi:rhamnopyranosyl-N-acetylglucosaminyl-diphospho-decaprenol beta-1,3/1,4-galactofuranosyltransferase